MKKNPFNIVRDNRNYDAQSIIALGSEDAWLKEADARGHERNVHATEEARIEALKGIYAEAVEKTGALPTMQTSVETLDAALTNNVAESVEKTKKPRPSQN